MTEPLLHDFCVIGAGIAGMSLAWRLVQHRSVVVLEREPQPGMHSTGRSAAMFMQSYGPPAVRALTRASRAFYLQPPAGFSELPLVTPRGALYLAQPGQEQILLDMWEELAPLCPGLQRLDRAAALRLVPCLRPERVHAALLDPDAMDIDVNALLQGFSRGLRQRGGTLRCGAEVRAAALEAGIWQLMLADGSRLRARSVVNAAGAWCDQVARLFAAGPIGLEPRRRSAFTFAAPAEHDSRHWPVVAGVDEGWYFKPDAGQLLGSPANADPTTPHDVQPEQLDIATGIANIEAVTTLTIARPRSTWAGLRSFVADGELVIGWDDVVPGFFWLAGQGGYGIQSAAGASHLAQSLLLHAELPPELRQHGVAPAATSPQRLR